MPISIRFIAEVSSNHHRDLKRCLEFVEVAAELGCDAVKFQLFRIKELFAPEVLARSSEHRAREQWELPPSFLAPIAAHCRRHNIEFCCTPFFLDAVAMLDPFVSFFKIASYELLWLDILRACARTGKEVVLSTGMADFAEVVAAVACLRAAGCQHLSLLHCKSIYPAPADQCNLAAIEALRACNCPVGWSDHSRDPAVLQRAAHRWGASTIEFHLDLDGQGDEFRTGHCWLPQEIAPVIADLRRGLTADGNGIKQPDGAECLDRAWRADPSDGLRPLLDTRASFNVQV